VHATTDMGPVALGRFLSALSRWRLVCSMETRSYWLTQDEERIGMHWDHEGDVAEMTVRGRECLITLFADSRKTHIRQAIPEKCGGAVEKGLCLAYVARAEEAIRAAIGTDDGGYRKLSEIAAAVALRYDAEFPDGPPVDFNLHAATPEEPGSATMKVVAGPGEVRPSISGALADVIADATPICFSVHLRGNDELQIQNQYAESQNDLEYDAVETLRLMSVFADHPGRMFRVP
jgi:hypothetical protein